MPYSPPPNRNAFALSVLFMLGVIVTADILAITTLGQNSPAAFTSVTTVPPAANPVPPAEVAPLPHPVD